MALKDASNGNLMDFSKDSNGNLTDSDTKKQLKNLGVDKFEKLEFRYKPARSSLGQVVLHSKTEVKGLHEKSNREIVWEISGIKVEDVSGQDQVTLCPDSEPLKILCGNSVTGSSHGNGGGFVENTANVESGVYVAKTAVVCGTSRIKDSAKVLGNAQVTGNAEIKGNALVYDNAKISDNAVIEGNARVYDSAKVLGDAVIKGNAKIYGMATVRRTVEVKDDAEVFGQAIISNNAKVYDNAKVRGAAEIFGQAQVYNNAEVYGNAKVMQSGKVYDNAEVYGNASIGGPNARVYGNAKVFDTGKVMNSAQVYGNAHIFETGRAYGNAEVYENAHVRAFGVGGDAKAHGNAKVLAYVYDTAQIAGDVVTGKTLKGNCVCTQTRPDGETRDWHVRQSCSSGTCQAQLL